MRSANIPPLMDYQGSQKRGTAATGKLTEKQWHKDVIELARMLGWTVVH